ncbi:hypothetical protein M6B38_325545 [Iris pallida]|uniref:Uncharacterized protein n=1 Tax=Iris pallida TaxID=29817 RepID=A0AAX6H8K7_IRIPA|nr:hypothetical protein M6B38_325545 [Iris pallida]
MLRSGGSHRRRVCARWRTTHGSTRMSIYSPLSGRGSRIVAARQGGSTSGTEGWRLGFTLRSRSRPIYVYIYTRFPRFTGSGNHFGWARVEQPRLGSWNDFGAGCSQLWGNRLKLGFEGIWASCF